MRRERNLRFKGDLFESLIDPSLFELPKELAIVDRLLDDEALLEPIRQKLPSLRGRPSIPLETYLRMMYLKRRYRLGFEALVQGRGEGAGPGGPPHRGGGVPNLSCALGWR